MRVTVKSRKKQLTEGYAMKISARNILAGNVSDVQKGQVVTKCSTCVSGNYRSIPGRLAPMSCRLILFLSLSVLLCLSFPPSSRAQVPAGDSVADTSASMADAGAPAPQSSSDDFFHRWFSMVTATQDQQPHWITPVVTVTPRLEQEFRYDMSRQVQSNGTTDLYNFGGSKGIEIIPSSHVELLINPPPYIARTNSDEHDGFGDFSYLLKYRILASNEQNGNYILTAFFGGTFPTGSYTNGTKDATISTTLAAGKGWGDFDLTSTLGAVLPVADTNLIGRQIVWNTVAQYRVLGRIWPEVEVNYTYFSQGPDNAKTQVFLTPGIVLGRFPIWERVGFTIGAGEQIVVTQFHTYNHKYILTTRIPF